ncbi:M24 family metallopeptidase [Roseibium sp.]|uniref:M24 family metallopeptidase n=1 Tax=Roseibium sp. TaxID=1936156 RepID=UPI003A971E3E
MTDAPSHVQQNVDFPESEFAARLEKAQAAMQATELDALLLSNEPDVRYFSGFRTQFWQSPTRPWFLIVPAKGKPIAVIPEIGAPLMRTTWIEDIRSFPSPHATDDGVSLLANALEGLSLIGLPMGRESLLRMPLRDYDRLRAKLHKADFVDVTPLLRTLRQVKSPAEIEQIRHICDIASKSFGNAPQLFREGQTLKEAFRAFRLELLTRGADDVPYLVGGAGPDGYSDVISPPSDQRLKDGDILMLDTGASLNGYFCDFDRNFAIGTASDTAKEAYRTLYRATEAGLKAARPGITCAQLFQVMLAELGAQGGNVGRFGHGLGMQLTESPSLIDFDQTVLETGMVLTLEPSIQVTEETLMVQEENILITEGAPELLSHRAPDELPILT